MVKIVHIIPATGQVSVLSIPRDTVVSVAGDTSQIGTYNRINATYNNGPDQLVQTIEANFGIPIEHVVQLNFIGFRGAVDAIGGVNLDFPYPARDTYTGLEHHRRPAASTSTAGTRWPWPAAATTSTTRTGTGSTTAPVTSAGSSVRTPS